MKSYCTIQDPHDIVTKEYVDGIEITQSAPSAITIANNHVYYLSDVSSLTFTYPASGHWECLIILTTAASGTVTVTFPTSSYIGITPSFGNNETWEISIRDGVIVAGIVS